MSKAFKKHIGLSWRPEKDYDYGAGGKIERMSRGKKVKTNRDPVRAAVNPDFRGERGGREARGGGRSSSMMCERQAGQEKGRYGQRLQWK